MATASCSKQEAVQLKSLAVLQTRLQEIFNISRMKKIILFGFVISSFLLTLALGLYQQATTIDESEFVNFNRDIVNIDQNKNYNEAFEDFQSYFNLAGVYAVGKTLLRRF